MKNIYRLYTGSKKQNIQICFSPKSILRNSQNIINLFLLVAVCAMVLILIGCSKQKKKAPALSKVIIRTVPDKANITLISHRKKIGFSPWSANLPKGMYVFEFSKPGYKTTWRKIFCTPGSKEPLEVKMEPIATSVIVETTPEGVTLKEGNKVIGETPLILHNLSLGVHTYSLSKPGYSPREITVQIDDERPKLVTANMNSNIGTIVIRSNPPDCNIFIDGEPKGKTPATLTMEQGDHNLKIQKTGFAPYKESVAVLRGETTRVNVNLQELPGSIEVVSNPKDSTLIINGKQYNNTPTTIKNLPPGKYTIQVSHDKYDTSTRTVSLAAGQDLVVKIKLDTNMGGIDLIAHPPGITVYVDGRKLGVTKEGATKDLSKIFEIRNLKSGPHTVTLAHKRAQPSVKKFKVIIKKGQILRPKQIRFWVRDTYIKLKDGREYTGRIAQENEDEVLFEPDPTMRIKYTRDEIKELRPLKEDE